MSKNRAPGIWAAAYSALASRPALGRYHEALSPQLAALQPPEPAAAGLDMCAEIEKEQVGPSTFHIGAYGTQIHEQTEMATLCWGQYEHNNQPVHHMLWMLAAADNSTQGKCASRAQYWLRQATSLLYKPGADYAVAPPGGASARGTYRCCGARPHTPPTAARTCCALSTPCASSAAAFVCALSAARARPRASLASERQRSRP